MSFLKGQPDWAKTLYGEGVKNMEGPTVKLAGQGTKTVEIQRDLVKQ
jgi:hypothetical protein